MAKALIAEQAALVATPESAHEPASEIGSARATRAYLEVDLDAIRHNADVI